MSTLSSKPDEAGAASHGFDSPVVKREADHLNRWPLAREIFGIATTGPKEWSVRIGIYGEWGSGKTSVLRFISSMAESEGHIAILFNPWQHASKESLWRAFVLGIFGDQRLKDIPGAFKAKAKGVFGGILKRANIVESGTAVLNEKAAKGVGAGLELVKSYFSFSQKDLRSLENVLGKRRVIVLIDDLDRTASELVPEILFALKELMDVPGFSFICAFDPVVVGEVLGKYHPGFGDGLKFLDKIIDYPRWLPPASAASLTKLALADAKNSCDYVPESHLREAIPLLPANPRAIRQFIRMLALLKSQIERHYEHELRWPAIIAANILKVRYPRIAPDLLGDTDFWDSIGMIGVVNRDNEKAKAREAVEKQVKKVCDAGEIKIDQTQQKEVVAAMIALTGQMGFFGGLHGESVSYQFKIAEAPHAVTWKEFDEFLVHWDADQTAKSITKWIKRHANIVERTEPEVYCEILQAAIGRYVEALRQADSVFVESDKQARKRKATSLIILLEVLVFELGDITKATKRIGDSELEMLVEKFASFAGSQLSVQSHFWPRNEAFLLKLFDQWSSDVLPLIRIVRPYNSFHLRGFNSPAANELRTKLCAKVLPSYARQVIAGFRQDGFIEELHPRNEDDADAVPMIWDLSGPVWTLLRAEVFKMLSEASSNRVVQENAYEFLHWFVVMREGHVPGNRQSMEKLLSNQSIFDALWNAAIATQLGPYAVYQLRELPNMLKKLGVKCTLPTWWEQIMSTLIVSAPPASPPSAPEGEQPNKGAS